jgi:hypothetical protein
MSTHTLASFILAVALGGAAHAEPRPARACQDYGLTKSRAELPGGYVASFSLDRFGGHSTHVSTHQGMAVRIVADRERQAYAGYLMEIQPAPEGRPFRVAIKPLPADYEFDAKDLCGTCPAWTLLDARLARYPEPFEVKTGATFRVDLLVNPKTGEALGDIVKVVRGAASNPLGILAAKAFKVDFDVVPEQVGDKRMVNIGYCVRDAATGAILSGLDRPARMPLYRDGQIWQSLSYTNTPAGRSRSTKAAFVVEDGQSRGTIHLEIREAGEILHAEEVRVPLS